MGELWDLFRLHTILIVVFYIVYTLAFYLDPNGWVGVDKKESLLFLHSFYFVFTTHTTVGFGDIFPKRLIWRMVMTLHIAMAWVLTIIGVSSFFSVQPKLMRRMSNKLTSPFRSTKSATTTGKAFFSNAKVSPVAGIKKLPKLKVQNNFSKI